MGPPGELRRSYIRTDTHPVAHRLEMDTAHLGEQTRFGNHVSSRIMAVADVNREVIRALYRTWMSQLGHIGSVCGNSLLLKFLLGKYICVLYLVLLSVLTVSQLQESLWNCGKEEHHVIPRSLRSWKTQLSVEDISHNTLTTTTALVLSISG